VGLEGNVKLMKNQNIECEGCGKLIKEKDEIVCYYCLCHGCSSCIIKYDKRNIHENCIVDYNNWMRKFPESTI